MHLTARADRVFAPENPGEEHDTPLVDGVTPSGLKLIPLGVVMGLWARFVDDVEGCFGCATETGESG
jgi:hypothetical protein